MTMASKTLAAILVSALMAAPALARDRLEEAVVSFVSACVSGQGDLERARDEFTSQDFVEEESLFGSEPTAAFARDGLEAFVHLHRGAGWITRACGVTVELAENAITRSGFLGETSTIMSAVDASDLVVFDAEIALKGDPPMNTLSIKGAPLARGSFDIFAECSAEALQDIGRTFGCYVVLERRERI
jgi:hypothetical protein